MAIAQLNLSLDIIAGAVVRPNSCSFFKLPYLPERERHVLLTCRQPCCQEFQSSTARTALFASSRTAGPPARLQSSSRLLRPDGELLHAEPRPIQRSNALAIRQCTTLNTVEKRCRYAKRTTRPRNTHDRAERIPEIVTNGVKTARFYTDISAENYYKYSV